MSVEPTGDTRPLVDQIAALTEGIEATEHVGRHNRLFHQRERLFEQVVADPHRLELLTALLEHPQPQVQLATVWHCAREQVLLEQASRTATALAARGGVIGREVANWHEEAAGIARGVPDTSTHPHLPGVLGATLAYPPMPPGVRRAAAVALIEACVEDGRLSNDRARAITGLLQRAIRLWPVPAESDLLGSRFGGPALLPEDEPWPVSELEEEPMRFLGQINCADLHAAVGGSLLPDHGVLQFYADHDVIAGCGPFGGGTVLHFADPEDLQPALPPDEDEGEPIRRCGLAFRDTLELPDPQSSAVAELRLTPAEAQAYGDVRVALSQGAARSGDGDDRQRGEHESKLLGWPDLVQEEDVLDLPYEDPRVLLLQIGWYHDGVAWQSWDPGGHIYFVIGRAALAEQQFDEVEIFMQST